MMKSSSWSSALADISLLLLILLATPAAATQSEFDDQCTPKIYDITHTLSRSGIQVWEKNTTLPVIQASEAPGSKFLNETITLGTHWGSHVDSPGHLKMQFPKFPIRSVDQLKPEILMGPVSVVQIPPEVDSIDGLVLQGLSLPKGLKRVIFKTKNTDRKLMDQPGFAYDYTGLTVDGAEWLASNTAIIFVGIDYMSIARDFDNDPIEVHLVLFNASITPVECLKLDEVKPGAYNVYCLPLRIQTEASPVRCILVE